MKSRRVLIADENPTIRLQLSKVLVDLGHQVRSTASAATVQSWLRREPADLVILEASGEIGFELARAIREDAPELPIILTSSRPTLSATVAAARLDTVEFLAKPVDDRSLLDAVEKAFARPHDPEAARAQARATRDEHLPLVGTAGPMQKVYRDLARLADAALPVLIWGETGVGKTLAAQVLHDLGPRAQAPFVRQALDDGFCEFAPQGAGTLLLECVDDLGPEAQSRLLHALEQAALQRAGDAANVPRLVFTARQDLRQRVKAGAFREDLYFRLSTAEIRLPALRERLADLPDLARSLLLRASREGLPARQINDAALARLQLHPWPGNVRELDNLLRRLCVLHREPLITQALVEAELATTEVAALGVASAAPVEEQAPSWPANQVGEPAASGLYEAVMAAVEGPLLQAALTAARGNTSQAAEILGIDRRTFRRKLKDHSPPPQGVRLIEDRSITNMSRERSEDGDHAPARRLIRLEAANV